MTILKGMTGKHHSEETKRKISIAHKKRHLLGDTLNFGFQKGNQLSKGNQTNKGRTPWNKGKKMNEDFCKKASDWQKGKKLSPEHIKKILRRNTKSSLEMKFEEIINRYSLPYKFVGNGEVLIGRKCPDFINTNGQKIAIEVYYRKHKEMFREGLRDWMEKRWKLFNSYGFELKFFDETQVTEPEILRRLG